MAIGGRIPSISSNVVKNAPSMPVEITSGSVTWGESWDGEKIEVGGSIVYEGVDAEAIGLILQTYRIGFSVLISTIKFEVTQVGYTRNLYPIEESNDINTYNVTVTLGDPNRNKDTADGTSTVATRTVELGKRFWTFDDAQMIGDGENFVGAVDQGYNEAEITWDNSGDTEVSTDLVAGNPFVPKEPVIVKLIESSKDPTLPPENTFVLRDTTSNYDQTGEKKVVKETTEVDGTSNLEIVKMYGFDYTYEDIDAGDGILYNTDPAQFWKQISYQETRYVYRKADSVDLQVNIRSPRGSNLKFVVHPDYEQFATVGLNGGSIKFKSNAEFLVEVVTKGWNLHRFKSEDDSRNTLDPEDPYYELFKSVKVPFYSRTAYLLRSSRGLFGEKVEPPFSIEFQDYDQLEPRIKLLVARSSADEQGRVAILYPDPNFVEPLYVAREATRSLSFDWRPDPEAELDPDRFIGGTDQVAPVPRLMTGQESSNEVTRTITSSDRFRELISEFSSQDPGFDNAAEKITFRIQQGRPPAPQHRIQQWEQQESTTTKVTQSKQGTVTRYYVSTVNAEKFPKGGSVSFPNETSLGGAVSALEKQLRKSSLNASQQQKTVAWFYPEIRAGDRVSTPKDKTALMQEGLDGWRVKNVTHKLVYKGKNNLTNAVLVTTPGTQITLGAERKNGVTVDSRDEPIPDETAGGDPTINVTLTDAPNDLGVILPPLPNRRNF